MKNRRITQKYLEQVQDLLDWQMPIVGFCFTTDSLIVFLWYNLHIIAVIYSSFKKTQAQYSRFMFSENIAKIARQHFFHQSRKSIVSEN